MFCVVPAQISKEVFKLQVSTSLIKYDTLNACSDICPNSAIVNMLKCKRDILLSLRPTTCVNLAGLVTRDMSYLFVSGLASIRHQNLQINALSKCITYLS